MLGLLRQEGTDPATLFTGQGHAPAPPAPEEAGRPLSAAPPAVRADLPDWLLARFAADLGDAAPAVAAALRDRAPVFLRVNLARTDRTAAAAALAAEGIGTRFHPEVSTALEVTRNTGRIRHSAAYAQGLVEVQDAASQAAVLHLPSPAGARILDYCAGGGGKALALAALGARVTAHDGNPARMADLPARAARAGARIATAATGALAALAPFDGVLVDAPCSGSGTWRRAPAAKWTLTPAELHRLTALQDSILDAAAALVGPGGWLAHATCSVLAAENAERVAAFRDRHPGWTPAGTFARLPDAGGDGFFLAVLRRIA
jgi:16S rRNA (cytosine967-C5)-methyltransferase